MKREMMILLLASLGSLLCFVGPAADAHAMPATATLSARLASSNGARAVAAESDESGDSGSDEESDSESSD